MKRLAVVTSIDRRSAIARATLDMALELAQVADVTVFAEPTAQPLKCPLPLRPIDEKAISAHDHSIVALGDSPHHIRSFGVARNVPSVVILHDVLMAHLVHVALPLDELAAEVTRFYGAATSSAVMRSAVTLTPHWDGPDALAVPLFESAVESATGVIVHSNFAASHVQPRIAAPVTVLPLAYRSPWTDRPPLPGAGDRMLLTMGHANPNKSHELVIEAMAEMGDPTLRYVIAGSIEDERAGHLRNFARALGLADHVEITGHVGTEAARHLLGRATLCVNLRMPAIEGGSASLVEQMAAGKPVVVFDHGCYADAPDDAVLKMPVATTPADLASALSALLDDPSQRAHMGDRARAHVEANHTFDGYAHGLLSFLDVVESAAPMGRLVRRVAQTSSAWGMQPDSTLPGRWARMITTMTTPPGTATG